MAKDGSSSPEYKAEQAGGGRPLAKVGCALRGGHTYVASRRLDGYDTCTQCGHRRKTVDGVWLAEPEEDKVESASGPDGLRPMAALGCALRRYHNFVPSRRMEGYDTCLQCGFRRKAPKGSWFAAPPPKSPSQAAVDAGPISTPEPENSKVVIPFAGDGQPMAQAGIDPRVLRQFLRQIDAGELNNAPKSGGRRRRPQTPQP